MEYEVELICPVCNGKGWYWGTLPKHYHLSPSMMGTDKIKCKNCKGNGKYWAPVRKKKNLGSCKKEEKS